MTPARRAAETANKRAERQRRVDSGERRVEVWLSNEASVALADMETVTNDTASSLIQAAVLELHAATLGGRRGGLEEDLRQAVLCAYLRGAREWAVSNYPAWKDWLESHEDYEK